MKQPIQWATASNRGRAESANGARLVNLFAESLPPDSKSPVALYGTPGLSRFCHLPTYPVLALHRMGDMLYAVTPTALYEVDHSGSYTEVGEVDLGGVVSTADNGKTLVMVDGSKGYAYSDSDDAPKQLEGDGWYPSSTVTYQDGYFIFNRKGTGQFFLSRLLSVEFDALDYATAEGAPDNTVAVLSDHRELWVFGENSTEVWFNSGDPGFPFERMQGAFIERGTAACHTIRAVDSSVYWLGDDGIIYRAAGYQPRRLSTHAMETAIADHRGDAFAFDYTEEGHKFYVITFPRLKQTWCYDIATGLWHERKHYHWGRHPASCYARAFGVHLVGNFQSGMIHILDMAANDDDGDPIERIAVSPPMHNNRQRVMLHSLELDMSSGVGITHGQGDNPQAMLQWSDDGGETWSNEHWSGIGRMGRYLTRVIWRRLGSFRQRQFKVVISDPVPVVVLGAYVEVSGGRS